MSDAANCDGRRSMAHWWASPCWIWGARHPSLTLPPAPNGMVAGGLDDSHTLAVEDHRLGRYGDQATGLSRRSHMAYSTILLAILRRRYRHTF